MPTTTSRSWTTPVKLPEINPDEGKAVHCTKCGGTGVYCMGILNGQPWSTTGTTCFRCQGKGYIIHKNRHPAHRAANQPDKIIYMAGGTSGAAIFERNGMTMLVSYPLDLATVVYRSKMSPEDARKAWKELQARGYRRITAKEALKRGFTHEYVYDLYR